MTELESACVHACGACAEICEQHVRQGAAFRGHAQYSVDQLALITCGEVCRVAANSIPDADCWIDGVCDWCADVCLEFAGRPRRLDSWPALEAAAREAARTCRTLASAIRQQRDSAA
jgi:hypothetical protein